MSLSSSPLFDTSPSQAAVLGMWRCSPRPPYKHELRDPEQFRVVKVAAGVWNDPIRCKLIERTLGKDSRTRPYTALSYVWGPSSVTDEITVDGIQFEITLNLYCALRHLRKVDKDILLWVDALCINQEDHEERSLQVSIMQSIYRNAAEVVVFMGDGRGHRVSRSHLNKPPVSPVITLNGYEGDNSFFSDIRRTFHTSGPQELASNFTAATCAMSLISLFSDQDAMGRGCVELRRLGREIRDYLFECLRAFVICPWWSRVWVVQEIAVGRIVTIHYGTSTLPWKTLVATANVWSLPITRMVTSRSGIEPENLKVFELFANQVNGLEETRRRWHAEGGIDLARLLQEFSDRRASDDRDKVYGLLSLAKQDQRYIKPNYEIDVFETYKATTLALIGNGGSLACWVGDQKRKFTQGLPSWIPDWSTAVDNGDKRRMDVFNTYNVNCGWTLKVIESERDYWTTVENELALLIDSPAGQAERLPASLESHVLDYVDLLMQRDRSLRSYRIEADELERSGVEGLTWDEEKGVTIDSTMGCLKWCQKYEILPHHGLGLLQRWIRDLEKLKRGEIVPPVGAVHSLAIPGPANVASIDPEICKSLQTLCAAMKGRDIDIERRKSSAECSIRKIESILLGPDLILGREISLAIESLANQCRRLSSLCKATENEISPIDLFKASYTLRGTASWLTESQLVSEQPKPRNWGIGLSQCTEFMIPHQFLIIQMVLLDGVAVCGSKQFGWTDMKSALTTLVSWLYLSKPATTSGPAGKGEVQLDRGRIRQFAKTIVGGMCRRVSHYQKANNRNVLEPLEKWLLKLCSLEGLSRISTGSYIEPPTYFLEDIQIATDGRVFFMTNNGSMGLGPASMRKGDSIHILPSGSAHFVLRRKPSGTEPPDPKAPEWFRRLESDQHELIGDCYLHTDGTLDSRTRPREKPFVEGSLPFEVLGARYWREEGQSIRQTKMLV